MRDVVGSASRTADSDEIEIQITAGVPRRYRVLSADVPRVLAGYAARLYSPDGEPVGDICGSASGQVLLGASRAGRGFVVDGWAFLVNAAEWLIPRDHLRAHYHRHDGPVEVRGVE